MIVVEALCEGNAKCGDKIHYENQLLEDICYVYLALNVVLDRLNFSLNNINNTKSIYYAQQ